MKIRLRYFAAGLAVFLLSFMGFQAKASHNMWSDLTYSCASPGTYVVFLRIYRDCSGTATPNAFPLVIKSPNCNNGRTVTMTKATTTRIGNPYCSSLPNTCTTTGRVNFEEIVYSATVTFSATEQNCPDWVLSWTESTRPNTINILSSGSQPMYAEAKLKLLPGLVNNSPQFAPISNWFVLLKQPTRLSTNATDSDGDSLVYSIQNPLRANNDPINYASYSTEVIYNTDSTKYSAFAGGTFSNTYPIITYTVDWTQSMPLFPVKNFVFNSKDGSYTFTPQKYTPNTNYNQPANKYTMVVQVDEYRKINGAFLKIGSVRRDMFLAVEPDNFNKNPLVNAPMANGQAISENDVIHLRPGSPLNFLFATADGNVTDVLTVTSDAGSVLPGAVFTKTTNLQPTGTISWTPAANHVRDQIYYFHITVEDDGCPVKGHQTHTFGVKVSATGGVTGTKELQNAGANFSAFPNPFSEELFFKLNLQNRAESIVIYNLLGQQIDQIALNNSTSGEQNIKWTNAAKYAAGTYVAKLISENKSAQTLKFTKLQ